MNLGRLEMQQEARDGRLGPLEVAFGQTYAKDGAAYARAAKVFPEFFEHFKPPNTCPP
ncbi:hypothetical protein SBV1_160009 [Verrucomicrobia bacterium]|nr:hypothetical protein SBV1_160009 [Verrucomicrobiota bacterium]